MKVLQVSTNDIGGGAAKAAFRLHQALNKSDIFSTMLVREKYSDDPSVLVIPDYYTGKAAVFDALPKYAYRANHQQLFSNAMVPNPSLVSYINESEFDVIHFHWCALGFVSIEDFQQIRKPLVFSLHDMWAFTGGCHYTYGCDHYITACQRCPALHSESDGDLSSINFERKQILFSAVPDAVFVGLSEWMAEEARASSLLSNLRIEQLPNLIDRNIFKPVDKNKARGTLSIPEDAEVLIFAADGGVADSRKGYAVLQEALDKYLLSRPLHIITVGNLTSWQNRIGQHFYSNIASIREEAQLILLLSAADTLILPSKQENLSNLVLESLSCGTPVVAFNVGGNKDMVSHKVNGYLAKPGDANDLACGIEWVLATRPDARTVRSSTESFDSHSVAARYIELYSSLEETPRSNAPVTFPSLLSAGKFNEFDWLTEEFKRWITALENSDASINIYGCGIIGRYLYERLKHNEPLIFDKNASRINKNSEKDWVLGIKYLKKLRRCYLVNSLYDPNNEIREQLAKLIDSSVVFVDLLDKEVIKEIIKK